MPRTTLNLDPIVLDELKERARREGKPLGEVASRLLARSLKEEGPAPKPFKWVSKHMGKPRIDISDGAALWEFLDREMMESSEPRVDGD